MHTDRLKIVGCGGHCKVVLDALSLCEHLCHITLCDSDRELLGKELYGFLIDSTMESLSDFSGKIHIAIGTNKVRERIFNQINAFSSLYTVIHPAAVISKLAHVEQGSFIAAQAVLGPECYIGKSSIINHGAVVDHEVKVGDFSHIAPNSTLGGCVTVGKGVLIGAGATILPGVTIGDGAIIAAGAVVLNDVKEHTTVMGVPAVSKE
jgi:sugar O-acyltransferase (sialic acid O-acetyltransferase NeuD family)